MCELNLDKLTELIEVPLGKIQYQQWKKEDEFETSLGRVSRKIGKEYIGNNGLLLVNVHYLASQSRLLRRERNKCYVLPIYSHKIFKQYLGDYFKDVEVFLNRGLHICSDMLTNKKWREPLYFNLPCPAKINSSPILEALTKIQPDSSPNECEQQYGKLEEANDGIQDILMADLANRSNLSKFYQKMDTNLFVKMFGSLNLTLRVLIHKKPDNPFGEQDGASVVFYPITLFWENSSLVLAVMVVIQKHYPLATSLDGPNIYESPHIIPLIGIIKRLIYHVHHIDTLFLQKHKREIELEKNKVILKVRIEKIVEEQEAKKAKIEEHPLENNKETQITTLNQLIEKLNCLKDRINSAKGFEELWPIIVEVYKWEDTGK